jgi:hypothetical protein
VDDGNRMRSLRASFLACILFAALAGPAHAATPVSPADAFVDSIGVNVHMNFTDTAYADSGRLVDSLSGAGIRHVRDGLDWNTPHAYAAFDRLADRGIGTTFIMGEPGGRTGTLDQLLAALRTRRGVDAVEGPNEYGSSGLPDWAERLRDYQQRLYAAVKQDPALAHLPVLGPSLVTWQQYEALGDLRAALDAGNVHPYPGGDIPEAKLDWWLSVAAPVSGDRPVWATETGYHNATQTTGGHRPASEAAAATYLPRLYLEYFRRGIPRTFAYELIDLRPDAGREDQEANFGLLRNDYTEKPAYRRLANLIAVLSDPGPAHPVEPVGVSIDGAPDDLRRLLLQKRDGSYYLVLWRAARVWDPDTRQPLAVAANDVTVQLDGAAQLEVAEQIDPALGTAPFASSSASGPIGVWVGADPVIVRLAPARPKPAPEPPVDDPAPAPPVAPVVREPAGTLELSVPSGQRLGTVLRRGLLVGCRAPSGTTCKTTAAYGSTVLASGRGALDASGGVRLRVVPSRLGARVLRSAIARRRPMRLSVRAVAGGQPAGMRIVVRP